MSRFVSRRQVGAYPRLPLNGSLDLTYRCDNDCRHCWLRVPAGSTEAAPELSFEEIRRIVDEARSLGCREWAISGGEPMLRPDFGEIFSAIVDRSSRYTLNTNGTLITPGIARLLRRKGTILVALYGATAAVHDAVTRNPGSFAALERGIAYLREAGTAFTVQVVPMKTNIAAYDAMVRLAESWSPSWRVGATWLYLSASGDARRNRDIMAERLDPVRVVELDQAYAGSPGDTEGDAASVCAAASAARGGLYASCLAGRRDFHLDPYGGMSFCAFVKDPALRLDLRAMSFAEAWDERLPRLAEAIPPSKAYVDGCGTCELRADCKWCPVFAYLESRDHSARIDGLCAIARETRRVRKEWLGTHRRRFRVAGLAVDVEADLPITDDTFEPKFDLFRSAVNGPADISLRHHFSLPDLEGFDLGREVFRKAPWAVYRKGTSWIYVMISPDASDRTVHRVMVFDDGHTRGRIYSPSDAPFRAGGLDSLALLPSDQLVLARALPAFGGVYVHAAGVEMDGQGLVFAGPSEAGKSTIVKLIGDRGRVLCDDRVIVRKGSTGFRVHGTWNHGEIPRVSPDSAPLCGVFFLRQAAANRIDRVDDPRAVLADFLPRLVRPLVSADWWQQALARAGDIVRDVPFYDLSFDQSGAIVEVLEGFLAGAE
jgi:MoaA/NifB/PqqE/SkfB family radical SAM enzyme